MRTYAYFSAAAGLAATFAMASPANAVVFDWSFSGQGVSGGGTITATQDSVDLVVFHLTGITGFVNGTPISGLTSYDSPDQLVFYPNPPNVVVDVLGFAFGVGDGSTSYNIYEDFGNYEPGTYYSCGGVPYCILGPGLTDGSNINVGPGSDAVTALDTLTLSEVAGSAPEPSTWAMMGLGFAALCVAAAGRHKAAFNAA